MHPQYEGRFQVPLKKESRLSRLSAAPKEAERGCCNIVCMVQSAPSLKAEHAMHLLPLPFPFR
jgi:hypothetical protein